MSVSRKPEVDKDEIRARADALAMELLAYLKQANVTQYGLDRDGYRVRVIGGAAALQEVDVTEYEESNAGEGPD